MVAVDHNTNIQRIVDVIKSDNAVFDGGATPGKLRTVNFGDPNNNEKNTIKQKPAVYVTTRNNIQSTRYNFGTGFSNNQNQVTVEYEIVLLAVSKENTTRSQKQLYSIMTNLENLLESDPTFADPTTDNSPPSSVWNLLGAEPISFTVWETGTNYVAFANNVIFEGLFYECIEDHTSNDGDPIFTRSIVNQVPWDPQSKGQLITSITFVLSATIGANFSIDFDDIGNVILLSKPNAPEGIVFSDDRQQSNPNRVITPNGDFGAIFAEYESTPGLDDQFRAKFGTEETITINIGNSSRQVKVVYIEINPTAQFDEIERTILHMEIVKL